MTTEIAVSNRLGIALATDSAVTITSGGHVKVFNTADKLFELSNRHPVGVMINGNMDCLGVPWEILVKDFREAQGNEPRGTIRQWIEDLLKYIEGHTLITDASYVMHVTDNEIDSVQQVVAYLLRDHIFETSGKRRAPKFNIRKCLDEVIGQRRQYVDGFSVADSLAQIEPETILAQYSDQFEARFKEKFRGFELTPEESSTFKGLIVEALRRSMPSDFAAGIVVAGYGHTDTFPSVLAAEVDGRVTGVLKISRQEEKSIAKSEDGGQVTYFAQTDVIQRLLGGADPRFVDKSAEFIERAVTQVAESIENALRPSRAGKKRSAKRQQLLKEVTAVITEEYKTKTAESLRAEFSREFDRMIAMMPKQELIELAEALVSVTAVERKATSDEGTVGGPIDVAFITKHEGFVWIERKHYFESEKNPRYFWRKYGNPPNRGSVS